MGHLQNLFLAATLAFSMACTTAPPNSTSETSTNAPPAEVAEGLPEGGGGEMQGNEPGTLIAELYKLHDAQKGPFFERKRATIDRFFAKPLADILWKDEQRPNDQVTAMGADPLYDGQDFEIKNFKVGDGEAVGDKATVNVSFENFGKKQTVTFMMIRQGADWKIIDIKYPGGYTLAGVYRENSKEPEKPTDPSPTGEFEGSYRVGPTSCTVTPIKMAFEVRWVKGSGSEVYNFEGQDEKGYNFVAEPEPGKYNVFTFKDQNYDSGSFTRADGKTFPVTRGK